MLRALELVVAVGAVTASAGLAWHAGRELYHGACEDAHGAAGTHRRLRAQRMRIFALAGLSAVGMGTVALAQRAVAGGGVLRLAGGMLLFGFFAWVSARSARRASRQGSKRSHVRERMRAQARRRRQQRYRRRGGKRRARRRTHRTEERQSTRRQEEERQALRALGLHEGATPDEVKRAWRRQALRHHPDRHVFDGEALREQHAEAFRRAQRAYDTLIHRPDA